MKQFEKKRIPNTKLIGIFYLNSHFSQMWLFQSTDSVYLCSFIQNPIGILRFHASRVLLIKINNSIFYLF